MGHWNALSNDWHAIELSQLDWVVGGGVIALRHWEKIYYDRNFRRMSRNFRRSLFRYWAEISEWPQVNKTSQWKRWRTHKKQRRIVTIPERERIVACRDSRKIIAITVAKSRGSLGEVHLVLASTRKRRRAQLCAARACKKRLWLWK